MKFAIVADYFNQIEQESSRLVMTQFLADLLDHASAQEAAIISNLSLGQLNPPYIGTQFNLAEKSVVKVVAKLLRSTESAITKHMKKEGDLGLVVETGRWRTDKDLTVLQVYTQLCDIEKLSGTGSQEAKQHDLLALLHSLDQLSAKYVVRIVIGKLRLGFSDMTLVDALSWMLTGNKSLRVSIEDAYNRCVDIGHIAYVLKEDGIDVIKKMKIVVGIPIRPAAAERLPTAAAIIKKLGSCVAQPKIDGFRLQIHIDKTKKRPVIHFFSRNLQDMSAMFPDVVDKLKDIDVDTMIAEGEAISYDPHTGVFLPFQETVKRKRKHGVAKAIEEFPLKIFMFDLLYLNGSEYINKSHVQRRKKLAHVIKTLHDEGIQIIEEIPIDTARDLEKYFAQTVESGLEGLVVKRPDAVYQPGKRNFNWIKLKRQEEGHLEDTIDCVILGYYAGSGKRAQFGIGAFLVGVYNKHDDNFQTIAKVGTGLSDQGWKDLKKICDEHAVKTQPKNVVCAKELFPDVWVAPEVVCVVRADEITLSPSHSAGKTKEQLGYALRFPRFMGYRPDKSPQEATQVKEIVHLYKDQFA